MYRAAVTLRPRSWNAVETAYLRAIEALDDNLVGGTADMGDLQNGKGDFFNDLLALLLEGCTEIELFSRQGVPGFIFPTHNLDITYPSTGVAKFVVEAKALGTPKHPGSPREHVLGRRGSADIKKRVTELAFKTIIRTSSFFDVEPGDLGAPFEHRAASDSRVSGQRGLTSPKVIADFAAPTRTGRSRRCAAVVS